MNMWMADLPYAPEVPHLKEALSVREQENILCLKI